MEIMGLQTSIMYGFIMFIIMVSTYAYSEHTQKESCHDKAKLAYSMAEEAKKRYDTEVESYEYAIKEITEHYDKTISDINKFERGKDETECEAANRLLNSFKY